MIEVCNGFFIELREAKEHIERIGHLRWMYYVNAAMAEVKRCELAGYQFEPMEMLIVEEALQWTI